MKEEWLMPGAVVPVDPDTTKELVDEIKRLIGVIGGMALQAAAPVQEPVAWMEMVVANLVREGVNKHKARELAEHFYSHAQPAPVQEPLEEEWIAYCWNKSLIGHRISYVQYLEFVREVERAHGIKEKNT
jgi:hypothetical protein